jgi:CheY-like chemotaxis protein
MSKNKISILVADDDEDDRMMIKEAFQEARLLNDLHFVKDGEELMDYLYCRGKFEEMKKSQLPGLILLDLNMPRKDGRDALREIKADPELRQIPIVVLTTSNSEDDIKNTYGLGVSSYITKPVTFAGLVQVLNALQAYWLDIVQLPAIENDRMSAS